MNSKPECLYSFTYKPYTENENFIKFSSFLSKDLVLLITNKNNVDVFSNFHDSNYIPSPKYSFVESNYIYDFSILKDNYHSPLIFICSKDNPIRVLNDKLVTEETYLIKNETEVVINPNFVSIDSYGLNLFCGKNFLVKIDLISGTKEYIKKSNKFKFNLLSSFDYNYKNGYYLLGSFNKDLLFCDYKTNKVISVKQELHSINQIKCFTKNEYQFIVGYRNSDCINIYDIRNLNQVYSQFYRNCLNSSQKINFALNEDETLLYTGGIDGYIISYNLEKYEYANYFNVCTNEIDNIDIQNIQGISSLDIKDNILLVTTGKRKFPKYDDEGNIKEVETKANESNFQFWKI